MHGMKEPYQVVPSLLSRICLIASSHAANADARAPMVCFIEEFTHA
jgi:hypothetical protein